MTSFTVLTGAGRYHYQQGHGGRWHYRQGHGGRQRGRGKKMAAFMKYAKKVWLLERNTYYHMFKKLGKVYY